MSVTLFRIPSPKHTPQSFFVGVRRQVFRMAAESKLFGHCLVVTHLHSGRAVGNADPKVFVITCMLSTVAEKGATPDLRWGRRYQFEMSGDDVSVLIGGDVAFGSIAQMTESFSRHIFADLRMLFTNDLIPHHKPHQSS